MGDKGGKKDREKNQKQDTKRLRDKSRKAEDKLPKKKPI